MRLDMLKHIVSHTYITLKPASEATSKLQIQTQLEKDELQTYCISMTYLKLWE